MSHRGATALTAKLTVLGCITNVLGLRADDFGKALQQARDDFFGFVQPEGGLSEIGHAVGILEGWRRSTSADIGYENGAFGCFTEGADDFVVIAVANEDDGEALFGQLHSFKVDFGDKRACGVNHQKLALLRLPGERRVRRREH